MASIAERFRTRGRWHSKGWGLAAGSKGSMRNHNSSGKCQPSSFKRVSMAATSCPNHHSVGLGGGL